MILKDLLIDIKHKIIGDDSVEICHITDKLNLVKEGSIFVAIKGLHVDAHDFIEQAIEKGASAVVSDKFVDIKKPLVIVENTRKAVGLLAANFYGRPARKMKMLAVTGTNGKTSTTYMLKHILEFNNYKVGVIGTSGSVWNGVHFDNNLTTPDPIDLQKILFNMCKAGVEVVAMEVSAHALDLYKTNGIVFDVAIFTNLTQDHLDYFSSMQNYFYAKLKLFNKLNAKIGVVCNDEKYGKMIMDESNIPIVSFGHNNADFVERGLINTNSGQKFYVHSQEGLTLVNLPLMGKFNCTNAIGAMVASKLLGVSLQDSAEAMQTMPTIEGRFNTIACTNGAMIIIDYAHTPDGLQNVLKAARDIANSRRGRLISLFGCGGNRDVKKRPIMGKISQLLADYSVITSDNPRYENPDDIIDMIVEQMSIKSYKRIVDRKLAIEYAISLLGINDVLVVAGKGAENYMDIMGEKIKYSDSKTILNIIEKGEKSGNN